MSDDLATLSEKFNAITKPVSLPQIVDSILAILVDADANEGEFTPEQCEKLDALNLTLEQKAQAYHLAYRRMQKDAEACRDLGNEYAERARLHDKRAERLRERLQAEMNRLGTPKLKTPTVTAYFQDTTSVVHEDEVPADYVVKTVTEKPDKKRMAEELKAGKELGFAWLKKSTHLRFR